MKQRNQITLAAMEICAHYFCKIQLFCNFRGLLLRCVVSPSGRWKFTLNIQNDPYEISAKQRQITGVATFHSFIINPNELHGHEELMAQSSP